MAALRSISLRTRAISVRTAGSARTSSTPDASSATSCVRSRSGGSALNTTFSIVAIASLGLTLVSATVSSGRLPSGFAASRMPSRRSISTEASAPPAITTMLVRSSAVNSGMLDTMPCWLSVRLRAVNAVCMLLTTSLAFACLTGTSRSSGTGERSPRSVNATKRSANATASGEPTTVIALAPRSANTRTLDGSNDASTAAGSPAFALSPAFAPSPAFALSSESVTATDLSRVPPVCETTERSASATRSAPALRSTKLLTMICCVCWPRASAAIS